jgi:membrane fusion protein, copper/silver efflux system
MKYAVMVIIAIFLFACKEKKKETIQTAEVFYTCSMHPQIMQNKPGKCPICHMDLIPVEKQKVNSADGIMLSDQQIQLGNIQVDTIGKTVIGNETVLTATINIDETKTTTVSARISGRIEKLYFKQQGDYITKGAKLYDLYSEELNNAKQEYLLAVEKQNVLDNTIIDMKQLVQSARNKLLLWGMSESQIGELERTKKASVVTTYYSSASGYVTTPESHEGDYIMEGSTIVRLANLNTVWAEAQLYTSELYRFDRNATAIVRLPDLAQEISGRIQFVNPEINSNTRINLVRVSIPNNRNQLKPGMPAYVVLKNSGTNSLSLPFDAVIRNEKMNTVWIQVNKNTFKSVMVETGVETADRIEIRSGLNEGDIVVISGAYLLNSEYIFKNGANPMSGHDMSKM